MDLSSILCAAQCDIAAADFFTSVRDWGRLICTNNSRRKNLSIVLLGMEAEEHYVCQSIVFCDIAWRYHYFFKQDFGSLHKVMDEDQQCLRLILLKLKRHMEKLLKENNTTTQAYQHRAITIFFSPITPTHATSPSRATQMGSCKGVTTDQTIAFWPARRPQCGGPRLHRPCHQPVKAIISCCRRRFPSILDWPILEVIQRQKLQNIWVTVFFYFYLVFCLVTFT